MPWPDGKLIMGGAVVAMGAYLAKNSYFKTGRRSLFLQLVAALRNPPKNIPITDPS